MKSIFKGRYTAKIEGDFVIFAVGMQINRGWKIHRWLPIFISIFRMIRDLKLKPQSGFLHAEYYLSVGGAMTLQYWRTTQDLENFAHDKNHKHLLIWKKYNQDIVENGDVGIWHETYLISAHQFETIYINMPKKGLGLAGHHIPITANTETARQRLSEK